MAHACENITLPHASYVYSKNVCDRDAVINCTCIQIEYGAILHYVHKKTQILFHLEFNSAR